MTNQRQTWVELMQLIDGVEPEYPESTNDYVDRAPAQPPFWPGDKLVFLPRVQIVVIPIESTSGGWYCAVLGAVEEHEKMVGSNRIYVGNDEMASGTVLKLKVWQAPK